MQHVACRQYKRSSLRKQCWNDCQRGAIKMPVREIVKRLDERMKKSLEFVHSEFAGIRTGKASPALVENMLVPYYGTPTRLRDLAGISTPDPKTIVIQPWDANAVVDVEKTIQKSDLGLTPNSDGKIIRLHIPELTEERRLDLCKIVKKIAEEGKVALRNERRTAMEEVKKGQKDGLIPEDARFKTEKEIQDKTDKYCKDVDVMEKQKEEEIKKV